MLTCDWVVFAVDVAGDNVRIVTALLSQYGRVGRRLKDKEAISMKCHVRGSNMRSIVTSLPFKVNKTTIVILKNLPVLQCKNCSEYLLDDPIMKRVDEIVEEVDTAAELEVIKYAA